MADNSKKNEAHLQFSKLQRAEDGKKAMSEYEAEGVALRAKTARLKALRLAKEAADAQAAAKPAAAKTKTKKKPAKKAKTKSQTLSEWLKGREGGGRNR